MRPPNAEVLGLRLVTPSTYRRYINNCIYLSIYAPRENFKNVSDTGHGEADGDASSGGGRQVVLGPGPASVGLRHLW